MWKVGFKSFHPLLVLCLVGFMMNHAKAIGAADQVFPVAAFGARGDGVTDDTAAINAAVRVASGRGGGTVVFEAGRQYVVRRRTAGRQLVGGIWLLPGVSFDGRGATLHLRDNTEFFIGTGIGLVATSSVVTQDVSRGARTLMVTDSGPFNVGDTVYYRLGENGFDSNESTVFGFATVRAVQGHAITLDRSIDADVSVDTITRASNKSIYEIRNPIDNISIRNFYLRSDIDAGGDAEAGISISYARNISISGIRAKDPGAGVVTTQYASGIAITDVTIDGSIAQKGQRSKGRGFDFAESTGVRVDGVHATDLQNELAFVEFSSADIGLDHVDLVNTKPGSEQPILFSAIQGSSLAIQHAQISGNGNFRLYSDAGAGDAKFTIRDLSIDVDSDPYSLATPGVQMTGMFHLQIGSAANESYDLDHPLEVNRTIALTNGQRGEDHFLPAGMTSAIYIYASPTLNPEIELPVLNIGRETDNGPNASSYLLPGQQVLLGGPWGDVGLVEGPNWTLRSRRLKVQTTTASSGMTGKYIEVRAIICPELRSGP